MTVLLITYDLKIEGRDYPKTDKELLKRINEHYENRKLSESSYAIKTNDSPKVVFNKFEDILDSNDSFYVVTLCQPMKGQGSSSVTKWISSNLN